MQTINLKSDTQTLPTDEMLEAIRHAELGDDTYDADPTVQRLERLAAEKTGFEASLLCISGTMANLVALMTHAAPGDEVVIDPESHIYYYEKGSLASVAGLMPMPVASDRGMLEPDRVRAAIRKPGLHYPTARLLCLENTHNRSGGRVVPPDLHRSLCDVARDAGLAVHLDGARIFNAALAAGVPVTDYTRHVDSMMFCLSKGLSCPLGSMLCGSAEFIARADHLRKRLGGGMRQAGVIAAPGVVALRTMVDRLVDDHRHARRFAERVRDLPGLDVDMRNVETNMVYIDHTATGLSTAQLVDRLKQAGVLVSARPPGHIRVVLNRHHTAELVDRALERIAAALAPAAA